MDKLGGLVEIVRPVNSVMLGLAIIVGAAVTGGASIMGSPITLLLSFVTGFCMTGAAMAVNDYYDREIDAVNEPGRPIPSGRVAPSEAVALTAALSAVGLGASYMISLDTALVAAFSWVVMMLYSAWGKRTGFPGNLMVSSCISLPFIFGGLVTGSVFPSLYFSLMAFLSNTGREVTKGIVDVEGDKGAGVNTIAVSKGQKMAGVVASAFYVAAAAASIIPYTLRLVSAWYLPFVAVTDLGLIYSAYSLTKEPTRENGRKVKNKVLYFMLVGLVGFAAGSLL
jgi:geranylgeranylglycerol-phosphate geranylgeranyltransferase